MFPSRIASVLGKGTFENNYSLACDGTEDYVAVGNDSSLQMGTDDFSIFKESKVYI